MHVLPWSLHVLDSMQFSPSAAGESKWQSQTCSPALWTHASFSHFLSLRQVLLQLAQCSFFLKQRLSGLEQHLDSKQSSPSATHQDELSPTMSSLLSSLSSLVSSLAASVELSSSISSSTGSISVQFQNGFSFCTHLPPSHNMLCEHEALQLAQCSFFM